MFEINNEGTKNENQMRNVKNVRLNVKNYERDCSLLVENLN